ncbi:MAG: DUF4349 domain-containing protein [Candidatus Micrarchaeota archaeon]
MNRIAVMLFFAAILAGCTMMEGQGISSTPVYDERGMMGESASGDSAYGPATQVIQEGTITLRVSEGTLETKVGELKTKLKGEGAEITDISYSEYGERKQYTITIKTLPERFERINEMLKSTGEVKGMSVSLEDVTERYTDLETRITNKEVELSRLYDLYNRSEDVVDLLAVEKEVTRVETELDLLKGEKESLSTRIERSTIVITVYEDKPAGEQLTNPLEGVGSLFFGALAFGIMIIVGLSGFLLPLAVIVAIVWLVYTKVISRKKGPKEPEHKRIPTPD